MTPGEKGEARLLLEVAKDAFVRQVAKRVRPLARSYVEKWTKCEFWLYASLVRENERELRAFKPAVIETLRGTSTDELLRICRETRPDLEDLWARPAAKAKLAKEIERALAAVEAL